jgi:hypothetical protein
MRNSVTLLQRFSEPRLFNRSLFFLLTLGLTTLFSHPASAESPNTAPAQLKNTLAQIDAAANRHEINAVMQFYNPSFTQSDGLTRQGLEQALTQLWQRYPNVNYRTELQSWKSEGDRWVAETITYVTGEQQLDGKDVKLNSTLRSRQRIQSTQIVQQEILAERTQLTSGIKPPTVNFQIPEQMRKGQDYNFDAIVQEPLGEDLLLGAALEEPVQTDAYTKPSTYDLQALSAGGIFKRGKAPSKVGNYWLSAVLVRSSGMTMVTQRLQVVDR